MKKSTYNKKIVWIIDFLLMGLLIFLDQYIKQVVVSTLKDKPAIILIKNVLHLEYVENRGSAFGMLQNQKVFILFIGVVFMAAVIWLIFKLPDKKKFLICHVLLSMILAGGVGNMIDRVTISYVIDYIYFALINFPVFNFADTCVVIGVFGLFILFIFVYKESDLDFLKFKKHSSDKVIEDNKETDNKSED